MVMYTYLHQACRWVVDIDVHDDPKVEEIEVLVSDVIKQKGEADFYSLAGDFFDQEIKHMRRR